MRRQARSSNTRQGLPERYVFQARAFSSETRQVTSSRVRQRVVDCFITPAIPAFYNQPRLCQISLGFYPQKTSLPLEFMWLG